MALLYDVYPGDKVRISDDVEIVVGDKTGRRTRLLITAPRSVPVKLEKQPRQKPTTPEK